MKERPILFSGPMVRALLDGRKTQTRRVCKVRDQRDTSLGAGAFHGGAHNPKYWAFRPWNAFELLQGNGDPLPDYALRCPYGAPGDRLWVKETFGWVKGNGRRTVFRADGDPVRDDGSTIEGMKWKPSIFMPRHESRLTIEVTEVRVERVQDISEADAIAEGCAECGWDTARDEFAGLWESINGAESWTANPWVWVVSFKAVGQ